MFCLKNKLKRKRGKYGKYTFQRSCTSAFKFVVTERAWSLYYTSVVRFFTLCICSPREERKTGAILPLGQRCARSVIVSKRNGISREGHCLAQKWTSERDTNNQSSLFNRRAECGSRKKVHTGKIMKSFTCSLERLQKAT